MKCIKCGAVLIQNAKFCDKCGAQQTEVKKCSCGRILEQDYKYCPACGKNLLQTESSEKKSSSNTEESAKAKLTGMTEAISYLVKNGLDLDDDDAFSCSWPILIQAVADGNIKMAESLIESGADVNGTDDDDNTPLHKACETGNKKMVELLLKYQANVNIENDDEETPLALAMQNGNKSVIKLLKDSGAEESSDDDDEYEDMGAKMAKYLWNLNMGGL